MPKNSIPEYSATAGSNTDVGGIDIDENNDPGNINDAIREVMSHLKDVDTGTTRLTSIALTSVNVGDGGATPTTAASSVVARFLNTSSTTDDAAISIVSGVSGASVLYLGDRDADNVGAIQHDHSTGEMTLRVGGAEQIGLNGSVVQASQDIVPSADSTHDLGSSSLYWAEAYIDAITASGSVRVDDGAGTPTVSDGNDLISAFATGNASISVAGGTSSRVRVNLGDSSTALRAGLDYDNALDQLCLRAGGGDQVFIDASSITAAQDILPSADSTYDLGSSSLAWAEGYLDTLTVNSGLTVTDGGSLPAAPDTNAACRVMSTASGVSSVSHSVIAGNSGIAALNLGNTLVENNAGLQVVNSSGQLRIRQGNSNRITVDGTSVNIPVLPLWVDNGISFDDGTNTLERYTEGQWTAAVTDESGNTSSSSINGRYTWIGNVVHAFISGFSNIDTMGLTSGDRIRVSLPLVIADGSFFGTCIWQNLASVPGAGQADFVVRGEGTDQFVTFARTVDGGSISSLLVSNVDDGVSDLLSLGVTYRTSA